MSPLSPEHDQLSHLLLSPAWDGIIKAAVNQRVKMMYDQLVDPSKKRKERLPDDYIRGFIGACRWMLTFPEEEMNRAIEAIQVEQRPKPPLQPLFGQMEEAG